MDHVFRRQEPARGPGGTRVRDGAAVPDPGIRFLLNGRSTLLRDRPGDAAPVLEVFVRGVDDRIHFFCRDIALHDLNGLTCGKDMFG